MLGSTPVISTVSPKFEFVGIYDTDESNFLTLDWNENDTADRTLNFLVNSGSRNIDLSGNLTLAHNFITSGAYALTLTTTATTDITLPTTGTLATTSNKLSDFAATTSLELKGVISDETGSGALVFATSPTLVTPALGVASATSLDVVATSLTSGKAIDISDLDAITTGKAIHIDATGTTHTSGILVHIDSAGTVITDAGRLFLSDHTGATTTSGILNEFKTAANDETVLVEFDAVALTSGVIIDVIGTALTTGTALDIGGLNALSTGKGIVLSSTSVALAAGELIDVDHTPTADGLTAKTGATVSFASTRTEQRTVGTTADDFDMVSVIRTATTSGAGGTLTSAGSVGYFQNVATQTAGTLTDTVKVLELVQDADSTGDVIFVNQDGNGIGINIDTEATSADAINIDAVNTSGVVLDINMAAGGASTAQAITIDNTATASSGNILAIHSDGGGNAINVNHDGSTGSGIKVVQQVGNALILTSSSAAAHSGVLAYLYHTNASDTGQLLTLLTPATGSSAGGLLQITTQDATNVGKCFVITNAGVGNAIFIDHNNAAGQSLVIDAESTTLTTGIVDIQPTVMTTGTVIDIGDMNAVTTGKGIYMQSTSEALTSGILLDVGHTGSGSNADVAGNVAKFASSITDTDTAGTATENYDVVLISRTDVQNGAGGTLDADGALLKLESVATQTAGTLTSDVYAIEISHAVRSTSDVAAIKITSDNGSTGVPTAIDVTAFSVDEPIIKFLTDTTGSAKDPETVSQDDWLCVKNSAGTLLFIPCYAAS